MKITVRPGTYVVAVSGGVDSMTLLNLLSNLLEVKLIVAHFDHGIRSDSEKDKELVQAAAQHLGMPFVFDEGRLGPKASEATARQARYDFLQKVKKAAGAKAIITAHHQDDAIETAMINLLRGTNRRGLSSLKDRPDVIRPMLDIPKSEIIEYAKQHKLAWHEDVSNQDETYLRNYIRHQIVPKLTEAQRHQLIKHLNDIRQLNDSIDKILDEQLNDQVKLDKQWFLQLSHNMAREIMAAWLRKNDVTEIDKKRLELLVRAAKTFKPGKSIDVNKTVVMEVGQKELALKTVER